MVDEAMIAPPASRAYQAFLFDMDGTVLNSIAAAERIWSAWAVRHGVDVETFLPTIHGVRAIDTINRLNLPGVDAEAQAAFITEAEIEDVEGIVEIPGAAAFLNGLPKDRWAMVTSAPRDLALRRMAAAGIPITQSSTEGTRFSKRGASQRAARNPSTTDGREAMISMAGLTMRLMSAGRKWAV